MLGDVRGGVEVVEKQNLVDSPPVGRSLAGYASRWSQVGDLSGFRSPAAEPRFGSAMIFDGTDVSDAWS